MLPSNDVSVMELVAKAVGRLAQVGGTYAADYVEFEVKKSLEWLSGDRHEGRRHAAVYYIQNCLNSYFFVLTLQSIYILIAIFWNQIILVWNFNNSALFHDLRLDYWRK